MSDVQPYLDLTKGNPLQEHAVKTMKSRNGWAVRSMEVKKAKGKINKSNIIMDYAQALPGFFYLLRVSGQATL